MVVLALSGLVIIAVPGLVGSGVHVPDPVAVIVTDPPGSWTQLAVCIVPALGLLVTTTVAVSEQVPLVQMKLYTPSVLNEVIIVVGLAGLSIVADPGLYMYCVQMPAPAAAIYAVLSPGKQVTVWSGPALGLSVTMTDAVSVHEPLVHTK